METLAQIDGTLIAQIVLGGLSPLLWLIKDEKSSGWSVQPFPLVSLK
jgi:hypothetical protein